MGFILSPYVDIQVLPWKRKLVRGDIGNPKNQFILDSVRFNLLRDIDYYPILAWIEKFSGDTQNLAENFMGYVDGSRAAASSEWEACRP